MSRTITPIDSQARMSLLAELAAASNDPELRGLLTGHIDVLMPRFVCYHAHLTHLPRRTRRTLQRRWQRSLAALALLLALGQEPALAARIAVDGHTCTLIDAITAANTDSTTGGCRAGSGADNLKLRPKSIHTLTAVNNNFFGNTGLPVIVSDITIEGYGSTIKRDSGAPEFRILAVTGNGKLTLNETTVSGGNSVRGAGIFSDSRFAPSGTVTMNNSTVSGNRGRGVAAYHGAAVKLNNSTISGNSSDGLYVDYAGAVLTKSRVSGNKGSGVVTIDYADVKLNNSTVSGNNVDGVKLLYADVTLNNSTVNGNRSHGLNIINSGRDATVTNSTISNNGGAGVSTYQTSVTLINSTISGNQGGGVSSAPSCSVTLISSTVSGNRFSGVDMSLGGDVFLSRTVVSGNTTEVSNGIYNGTATSDDYNLFGHNGFTNAQAFVNFTPGSSDITATSDGTNPTALNGILNPTLTLSGGVTRTHNLVKGSPAVDAVSTGCPPPATDQRGVPRPQGSRCDIGAVELVLCNGRAATFVGTAANDLIKGTSRRDIIHGLGGNDRIFGLGGNDVLCGGGGNDRLNGGSGVDACIGGSGTDTAAKCEAVRSTMS